MVLIVLKSLLVFFKFGAECTIVGDSAMATRQNTEKLGKRRKIRYIYRYRYKRGRAGNTIVTDTHLCI